MENNWKKKKAAKADPGPVLSQGKVDNARALLTQYRKRHRDDSNEKKGEIERLEAELKALSDDRWNIRQKRVLQTRIRGLKEDLEKEDAYVAKISGMSLDTAEEAQTKKKKKVSHNAATGNRRRPSSHTRVIRTSRDRDAEDSGEIRVEDVVADAHHTNYVPPVYVSYNGFCPECNSQMQKLYTESKMACSQCGLEQSYLDSTTKSAGQGDERSYPSFSYKKINHFRDWLRNVQAKESTTIDPSILEKVCVKCKEQRIDPESLTPKKVKQLLKECKLRKYYENNVLIYSLLTGKDPPRFEPRVEAKLESMFMQIALPFEKAVKEICPDRKNFLSYSFVCFKFIQLLPDVDNVWLQSFNLLKGRDKLYKQDLLWRHMCKTLGWKFIPSV